MDYEMSVMSNDVFWHTLGERAIIIFKSVNTLIKLASIVISKLLNKESRVCTVLCRPELARYLPPELLDKVEVVDVDTACRDCTYIILLGAEYFNRILRTCSSKYIYVFTCRSRIRAPREFTRIYVKSITGGEYVLIAPTRGVYTRFSISNNDIVVFRDPSGIYGKALETLKNAMSSYGELTVKDAVRILIHELRVERTYARKVIEWLARHGYIKVVKGRLSLSSI